MTVGGWCFLLLIFGVVSTEQMNSRQQLLQDHVVSPPKHDRISGQDKFEISQIRNDTGENTKPSTVEIHIGISKDLAYPRGVIELEAKVISEGLSRKLVSKSKATLPYTPQQMAWSQCTSLGLNGCGPRAITHFNCRYRTESNTTWQLIPKLPSSITKAVIKDVTPGERYIIKVSMVISGVEASESVQFNLTIKPNPVLNIDIYRTSDSTNVTFKWPRPKGRIETYVVMWWPATNITDIHTTNVTEINLIATGLKDNDQMWRVLMIKVIPGELMMISIYTVSYDAVSSVKKFLPRMMPDQVSGIRAVDIHDTNMTLEWDIPRGKYDTFEVQYTILNEMMEEIPMKHVTNRTFMTITELRPYRNYSYTFTVISGTKSTSLRRSRPVSAIFTTSESRPEQVVSFNASKIRPRDITFEWSLPIEKQNGIIRRFNITYGLKGSTQTQVASFEPNEFRGVIGSLMPGQTYHFNIQAETIIGLGPGKTLQQQMPEISAPPKPKPEDIPVRRRGSSTVIEIRVQKDFFSEDNGAITKYSIIITEDFSIPADELKIMSWNDVQKYKKWPPYQVIVSVDLLRNGAVDFKIGEEDCEESTSLYCNGPLKTGATFIIKMRAYTDADKFTDTRYSSPIQTKKAAGEGLNAVTTHKAGNTFDIHVTWDKPEIFPDFYIVNVVLNSSETNNTVFHNVSGDATKTVFSDMKIATGFNIYVRAWTSDGEGLEITRHFKLMPTNISRKDILMLLCLPGGICVVIIGIAVYGYSRIRKRRQAQSRKVDKWEIGPDRLVIWQILGIGAFGVVKLGSLRDDQGNPTNVAVKMLPDGSNENDLQCLLHEITIMKELNKHPNIVSLLGCRTTGPYPLLVVEYCSRGDLQTFLRKSLTEPVVSVIGETEKRSAINARISEYDEILPENSNGSSMSGTSDDYIQPPGFPEDRDTTREPDTVTFLDMLNFGRQVATGMEYLSSYRIVHRDLAARNVLVCEDRSVKISDFGLSRDIYQEDLYLKRGNGRMPLKWMAIEALTHQVYTTPSDVWSFGILLWEIVTLGGSPYPGIPAMEILKQLQTGYRMERPERCSMPLYNVMLSCWRKNPRKRPTFKILREELDRLICMAAENVYFDPADDPVEILPENVVSQVASTHRASCHLQVKFVNDFEPRIVSEELNHTEYEA